MENQRRTPPPPAPHRAQPGSLQRIHRLRDTKSVPSISYLPTAGHTPGSLCPLPNGPSHTRAVGGAVEPEDVPRSALPSFPSVLTSFLVGIQICLFSPTTCFSHPSESVSPPDFLFLRLSPSLFPVSISAHLTLHHI